MQHCLQSVTHCHPKETKLDWMLKKWKHTQPMCGGGRLNIQNHFNGTIFDCTWTTLCPASFCQYEVNKRFRFRFGNFLSASFEFVSTILTCRDTPKPTNTIASKMMKVPMSIIIFPISITYGPSRLFTLESTVNAGWTSANKNSKASCNSFPHVTRHTWWQRQSYT